MNDSELTGKIDDFAAVLTHPTTAALLVAKKVPVSDIVEALTAKKGILVATGATQESCKTSLKQRCYLASSNSGFLSRRFIRTTSLRMQEIGRAHV